VYNGFQWQATGQPHFTKGKTMAISTRTIPANAVVSISPTSKYVGGNSMQNNGASWAAVQAFLKANKSVTRAQLTAHLQSTLNHGNFVRYQLGRGNLVAATK
jgi:hypothetical protein